MTFQEVPQNTNAEMCLIGCILKAKEALTTALETIQATDFWRDSHRIIFEAAIEAMEKEGSTDIVPVHNLLRGQGKLDEVGGEGYLMSCVRQVSSLGLAKTYAHIILEKSRRRAIILAAEQAITDARGEKEASLIADSLAQDMVKNLARDNKASFELVERMLPKEVERLESIHQGKLHGMPFGHKLLDRFTGGVEKGDLVVIGGYTSVGKTAMMLTQCFHLDSQHHDCGFVSLEMTREQVLDRWISMATGVEYYAMTRPAEITMRTLAEGEWEKVGGVLGSQFGQHLWLTAPPSLTVQQLEATVRRLMLSVPLRYLYVDYFQILDYPPHDIEAAALRQVARGLKALAKRLGIVLMVGSQLGDEAEQQKKHGNGKDKDMRLSYVKWCRDLNAEADIVMLLARDTANKPTELMAHIRKHRNGPTGKVILSFQPGTMYVSPELLIEGVGRAIPDYSGDGDFNFSAL